MTGYLTPEDFNPRSYKRSDYDGYHRALHPQISIHAPTRGATVNPKHYIGCTYFNPRSYKRSDGSRDTTRKLFQNFNPRSYKRSDSPISLRQWTDWNFNPRSYKRSDVPDLKLGDMFQNFNPRSYKRSDTTPMMLALMAYIFQSTLLQEERR